MLESTSKLISGTGAVVCDCFMCDKMSPLLSSLCFVTSVKCRAAVQYTAKISTPHNKCTVVHEAFWYTATST